MEVRRKKVNVTCINTVMGSRFQLLQLIKEENIQLNPFCKTFLYQLIFPLDSTGWYLHTADYSKAGCQVFNVPIIRNTEQWLTDLRNDKKHHNSNKNHFDTFCCLNRERAMGGRPACSAWNLHSTLASGARERAPIWNCQQHFRQLETHRGYWSCRRNLSLSCLRGAARPTPTIVYDPSFTHSSLLKHVFK